MCSRAPCVFTGQAQTQAGGWGYVSAKDGGGFDEGSTTITQVQGLRGCRNAGIPVPKEIIDKAVQYIKNCTLPEGGVQYSSKGGGGRPAITAAAIACLFNAGEYDDDFVPRMMKYCEQNLTSDNRSSYGHWHYAHFYYAQVQYREGGESWERYRNEIRNETPPRSQRSKDRRQNRRRMDPRLHRPHLHNRPQFDHPPTRQRLPADLSTLSA